MHPTVDEPWKWPTRWPGGPRVDQLNAASRPVRLREGQPGVTLRRPVVTWCWPSVTGRRPASRSSRVLEGGMIDAHSPVKALKFLRASIQPLAKRNAAMR